MNRTINILSTSRTAIILLLATLLTATAVHRKQKSDEPQPDGGDKE